MKIQKYGVTLKRLTKNEIELVRQWRNDPSIAKYMSFRDHITKDMQKKWFASINDDNNFYFIIEVFNKKIGLINIKNVDYSEKMGEGGIFIYDPSYQNDYLPYRASLALCDFSFYQLGLERIKAHILKNNRRAIRYNKSLGYVLQSGQDEKENQLYIQTKEDYEKCSWRIKSILEKINH